MSGPEGNKVQSVQDSRRWFLSVDEAARNSILSAGIIRTISDGNAIFLPDDHLEHVIVILKGQVEVSVAREGGRHLLLNICQPGDFMGGLAHLDGGRSAMFATARGQVTACFVPTGRFDVLRRVNPIIGRAYEKAIARGYRNTIQLLEVLILAPLGERLLLRLIALAIEQAGPELARFGVELKINQADLAAMVNSSRAKVNLALGELKKSGQVTTGFGTIIVHPAAFEEAQKNLRWDR
jgi:CRP/FNR family transcriptional regulator, cyclic AMP receptor protein